MSGVEVIVDDIIGNVFKNNEGQEYKILYISKINKNKAKKYRIRFLETGYERDIEKVEISRGKIKDRFSPSVFGIGILGNVKMVDYKREYSLWSGMLERCYNKESYGYNSYGAKGVKVCSRWHTFTNFIEDIKHLDGYNQDYFNQGVLYLDKDIKQQDKKPSEKVYSPDTCMFVSFEENNLYRNNDHRKKKFRAISPEGVIFEVYGLKEFCRNNTNLLRQSVGQCLKGKQRTHKGWTFEYIN